MADIFDDVAGTATAQTDDIFSDVARERKALPAPKPTTFASLYEKTSETPTLSERAARLGTGSLASSLTPPPADTTQIPRNVFTGGAQGAGMPTEEEKSRWRAGLSDEQRQQLDEFKERQAAEGTPDYENVVKRQGLEHLGRNIKNIAGDVLGYGPQADPGQSLTDVTGFVPPEKRREQPIATGITQAVSGLGTPENATLLAGSSGFGALPALARAGISAYFAAQMAKGAYDQVPGMQEAWARGDIPEVKRLATLAGVNVLMGAAAGAHGLEEAGLGPKLGPEPVVPKGTISAPLAMDAALERGGRRMGDFEANATARGGMGRLGEAERGIQAAKQARINAPVEVPKTYAGTEEPFLLGRPRPRTGLEQLSAEAADVARQRDTAQAFRQSLRDEIADGVVRRLRAEGVLEPRNEQGFAVSDKRAVRPEDVPPIERRPETPTYPLRDEVPPLGREPGEATERASIMRIGSKPSLPGDIPETLPPTHGDIFDDVAAGNRPAQPVEATPYQRQQAQLYVNRLRNPIEREHAQSVLQARLAGEAEPERISSLSPGRASTLASNVDDYLKRQQAAPAAQRFPADVVSAAEAEMHAAANLGESFDRPGRYHPDLGPEASVKEQDKAWYGVTANKHMVAGQFPRFGDPEVSLSKVQRAIQMGKGADYERIVGKIAEGMMRERESAQPIVAEYAPRLHELAGQVRDIEPDLAQTLKELAAGHTNGINNLREYIERSIGNAEAAAEFSRAVEDAAAEARGQAGIEETAGPGSAARGEGGRQEEGVLPGFEQTVAEEREATERETARQLTEQANRPPQSIESAAGEMERTSPLFRGTEASPQREIFQPGGDIFSDVAREKAESPKPEEKARGKGPGTTFYSNAFLDPAAWREAFPGVTKQLGKFGQTKLGPSEQMKGILREQTGGLTRRKEQLYKALETKAEEWDARPEKEQLDFILREQHGQKQVDGADQTIADRLRAMFAERRQQIEQLGHGAFNRWRENYFPQMWERPNQVRDWITDVLAGKRKLEGPKSFTRQRVFDDIQEGIDAGFKPLTTNPITLALAKLHEMDRYAMAHTTLDAMKKSSLAKPVMVGQQAPSGWVRLDDRIGTIYGSPEIPVKEAYDKAVWDRLAEVAKNTGIEHEREVAIGGKRLGYATPGKITTRFATPESVIAHEIGHNLDWKYGLKDQLVKNPLYAKELRALADLHIEGMNPEEVPASFQRYIRKGEEKMATMVEALIHAPDKFRQVAPNTYDFLQKFIADKPELKPLLEAKPSLRYGQRTSDVSAGGMVIHGYYYAPPEAARVFNNYLSPGLQRFKTYNAVRMVGNTLNQAQLGLSAFHLGFTSLDASVSDMALALERTSRGQVGSAMAPAMRSLTIVGSPINTLMKGNRLLQEYLEPGKYQEMSRLADAVAQAGGRVHMDPYYKNQAIESFWKAWNQGSYAKAGFRAFPAAMEYAAKPVMEYAVPRMKLGVFANLAEDALARGERENWTPEKTRYELNRAWDSVDNRMGQIVYDNLFWNRAVKDLGLVSVRSLGWNLGTAREIFGGGLDIARQGARLAAGEKAELTHRMAYVMALPIVVGFTGAMIHYLSTGKKPETLTDYFFPQTGKVGPNGRPERLSLPSYLKDLYSLNHDATRTVLNKVHPAITATAQFLRNEDYFGTEIHHPGDPFLEQRLDDAKFVAKQFLPFSVRNAYQRAESAGDTGLAGPLGKRSLLGTAESFIGLTPAPRSLTQTPAERLAHEDTVRIMPQGPRTREQFEHSRLLHSYENRLASGDMKLGDLRQEVGSGRITGRDAETIARTSRLSPIERDFNRLPLNDALDVWDKANAQEKKMLRAMLVRKQVQLENMPREERQATEKRMREALYGVTYLGGQPPQTLGWQPTNLLGPEQ
jgi:hypothetical protein